MVSLATLRQLALTMPHSYPVQRECSHSKPYKGANGSVRPPLEGAGEQGTVQGTGHHATLGLKPSRAKLCEVWSQDTYVPAPGMFLPVQVPLSVDPWEHDVMHLPVSFLQDVLAPACRGIFCG